MNPALKATVMLELNLFFPFLLNISLSSRSLNIEQSDVALSFSDSFQGRRSIMAAKEAAQKESQKEQIYYSDTYKDVGHSSSPSSAVISPSRKCTNTGTSFCPKKSPRKCPKVDC